ncbi:FHA domain-containing protein [Thermosporothrix hazakensis]|jgi:pSer/pThr/pTyr-binding forkhead associated (FHA) protein|uniref:FHA domain-containing protein n=2 Tax=Thermosporothrix TaxID=768650 RepID=A0A326U3Q2_THEHA|nr:FHA domain-containing protein [Thermosporothrix hazakensis]PZW26710.1 FHA domain-containing protein [Thermosporothrix hazakensis]BBH89408.1 hypothetical protein KTC_41590 [Thermosporothrix sp. COM3]GCE47591.1 hypothetical protein KTH_24600 [Thermosporothrix hazakensis]
METSIVGFPIWFYGGFFGGFACCTLAILGTSLHTVLRKRGTLRQLVGVIGVCLVVGGLLVPAKVWFDMCFEDGGVVSQTEKGVVLVYMLVMGWLVPLGGALAYCLWTAPRAPRKEERLSQPSEATGKYFPPRKQPGVPVPFVYGEEIPWGWLEYRSGNFQGQRLALKRAIMTIGRDEDNDIWLDDELASRHHAEIAWVQGTVYLTDCESLNGVLLNGRRVRGYAQLESNDVLEVGEHRFTFSLAEQKDMPLLDVDPLAHHRWLSSDDLAMDDDRTSEKSRVLPPTRPLGQNEKLASGVTEEWKETAELQQAAPLPLTETACAVMVIQEGSMAGSSFLIDRSLITLGRGIESDIVINDSSISRRHLQFLRQADGDYVQDIGSRNGTKVNDEPLMMPRRLQEGDIVIIGNLKMAYLSASAARTSSLRQIITPRPFAAPISGIGPSPIKLPSRQK